MTIINKVSNKTLMPGITPIPDVPDAPTIGAVTDLGTGTSVSVAYTAAVTGGTVTTFTATSTPGSFTGTGSSPITVSGLTAGTAYTFKVKGTNSTATGPESAASSSITPNPVGFNSIATVTVGAGGSSTITFSSIPQTYKHLQIRAMGDMSTNENIYLKLNGNDGTKGHTLQSDGTSLISEYYNNSPMYAHRSNTGRFGIVTDILDYSTTTKNKTIRSLAGGDNNGTGRITHASGFYDNTSAITSITIVGSSGGSFTQYSQFALYGIQG